MKGWRDRKKIVITYFDSDCPSDTYFDFEFSIKSINMNLSKVFRISGNLLSRYAVLASESCRVHGFGVVQESLPIIGSHTNYATC